MERIKESPSPSAVGGFTVCVAHQAWLSTHQAFLPPSTRSPLADGGFCGLLASSVLRRAGNARGMIDEEHDVDERHQKIFLLPNSPPPFLPSPLPCGSPIMPQCLSPPSFNLLIVSAAGFWCRVALWSPQTATSASPPQPSSPCFKGHAFPSHARYFLHSLCRCCLGGFCPSAR